METDLRSGDLDHLRPRLFAIAYRMLGNVHDAEDLAQEAFLRWHQSPREDVVQPEAWLVAVVTRLAIDRLRRRVHEQSEYPGPWLPEPIAPERVAPPPDRKVELASDLSMAFLVLLERLSPDERAAFLLREVFEYRYDDIARILEKSPSAARQIVHRARERVRSDRPRFVVAPEVTETLLRRFVAALEREDEAEMMALFAPEATLTSDGGGKVAAARRVIRGADRVVRMLLGIERKYGHPFRYRIVELNGEPALVQDVSGDVFSSTFVETDGTRILALYRVMNPDKLGDVRPGVADA